MPVVELKHAAGRCRIECGRGLLGRPEAWREHVGGTCLVVTDTNVARHHLERVERALAFAAPRVLVLPAGEEHKTLETWRRILDELVDAGAQRDVTLVALGGGVVGDMTGFAAATWMRGVAVVQAPTTLLAQVDAAVGGKTGVNLPAGKNLVGAFHQPAAVLADVDALATLPEREYVAGLAEVVKVAAIRDEEFLAWIEKRVPALLQREADAVLAMVHRSIDHKVRVVEGDEREAGGRALLNLGHTFGHAIEAETGYARFLHGEAVAIGMRLAARLSAAAGLMDAAGAERIEALLRDLDLPVDLPDDLDPERLVERMRLDKKNRAGKFRLILLERPGRAVIRDDIDERQLLETLTP